MPLETPQEIEQLSDARSRGVMPPMKDFSNPPTIVEGATREMLHKDPEYIEYAKRVYGAIEARANLELDRDAGGLSGMAGGRDAPMTETEYAEWLSARYSWFNNNTASMVVNWHRFTNMTEQQALAFVYGMKKYDASGSFGEVEGKTAAQATVAQAFDPINWLGFGTMKFGAMVPKWVIKRQMDDIAIRAAKKANRKAYMLGAAEGTAEAGITSGAQNAATMSAYEQAGEGKQFTTGEAMENVMTDMGLGAATMMGFQKMGYYGQGIAQARKKPPQSPERPKDLLSSEGQGTAPNEPMDWRTLTE